MMKSDFERMVISGVCFPDESEGEVPAKAVVCDRCDGKGSHVNPNVDGHGISPEEFAEDPDFERDYFAGVFDVPCQSCDGLRVVLTIDEEKATPEEVKAYWDDIQAINDDALEARRTMYMESGGTMGSYW